jgi:peptidoglycan/xylan/chitin deacetylase (PgdA/CDA1 family)
VSRPSLSVVVLADDAGLPLLATLDTLGRQSQQVDQVIVVADVAADRPWPGILAAVAGRPRVLLIRASGGTAAMRNAGLAAATGTLIAWIDEGDRWDSRLAAMATDALVADPTAGFVATLISIDTLSGDPKIEPEAIVPALTLPALLQDSEATPRSPIVRRDLLAAVGPFDETLPAFDEYDFWIRALAAGGTGVLLPQLLVTRQWRAGSWSRRHLEAATSHAAITSVIGRHAAQFAADPAASLITRERQLRDLVDRHRRAIDSRDRHVAELASLSAEIDTLHAALKAAEAESVDWGDLRHPFPVSHDWGYDRGTPVDRPYIEQFLADHAADVRGIVLEVQESNYTRRFGGDRVVRSDVVDVNTANPGATVIADLRDARTIADDTYDCFVFTQTIHVIDDMRAVLRECFRVLKPGGVLLLTLPSTSRVCLEYGRDGDFWRVTEAGARRLCSEAFPEGQIATRAYGNALTSSAFLFGLAAQELSDAEFEAFDPYHAMVIGVRATKPDTAAARACGGETVVGTRARGDEGVVLLYHRVAEARPDPHGLAVPPHLFHAHLQTLTRAFTVLRLDEFLRRRDDRSLPPRAVAITFDDGYRDNLKAAMPLLVRESVPAAFFLTTQALRGRQAYWWDQLESWLFTPAATSALHVEIDGGRVELPMDSPDARLEAYQRIHSGLVHATLEARDASLRVIEAWAGRPSTDGPGAMSAAEMQTLARWPGVQIGAHTVNHLGLPAQAPDVIRRELSTNKHDLERLLNRRVDAVAYPYGFYDERVLAIAAEVGFVHGLTCDLPGSGAAPLRVPRLDVKAWPTDRLVAEIESAMEPAATGADASAPSHD